MQQVHGDGVILMHAFLNIVPDAQEKFVLVNVDPWIGNKTYTDIHCSKRSYKGLVISS